MEKTNKELRAVTLQYQVGRTFALVMKKADNTLAQLFTLRVTQVLHHRQSGVPILLECERCVGYTSVERAADPLAVEPTLFNTVPRPAYWQGLARARGPRNVTGISVEEYQVPQPTTIIEPRFNRPNAIDTALFETHQWPYQKLILYPLYSQSDFYSRQVLYDN